MSEQAKVTGLEARFTAQWEIEVQVEPGSAPDRVMPYSKTKAAYRPSRMRLVFSAGAQVHPDPSALRMEQGSGYMISARESVRVSGLTIYGPRLKQDGTPGQHIVAENTYGVLLTAPEWAQEIALQVLKDLGGRP